MAFSVVSTDECTEVRPMLKDKAKRQLSQLGVEMVIQNDPFHKIKNSRNSRKDEFEHKRKKSQKFSATLEDLKIVGLQQIAIQMDLKFATRSLKMRQFSCRAKIDLLKI